MVLSLYSGRPCCYPAHGLGEIIRTILNDQVKEEITSAVESYFRFGRECRSKRAQNVVNSTHKLFKYSNFAINSLLIQGNFHS